MLSLLSFVDKDITIYGHSFSHPETRFVHHVRELENAGYVLTETDSRGMLYGLDTSQTFHEMERVDSLYNSYADLVEDQGQNSQAMEVMKKIGGERSVVVYFREIGLRCHPTCEEPTQDAWIVRNNITRYQKNIKTIKVQEYLNKYVIERIEMHLTNKEIYNRSSHDNEI